MMKQIPIATNRSVLFLRPLLCDAIGNCGNGDFILVFAARKSPDFETGAVYLMSHDYGWEEAPSKPDIVPQITRKLASNVKSFLKLVVDENAELPMDYFDGNNTPYQPDSMKRKKAKRKLK